MENPHSLHPQVGSNIGQTFYKRSRQLKKVCQESWSATRESIEEKACPSQENTLSKVHRDRQAVAQNLRVWTRKTCPERDPFPTRQDEKNKPLDSLFRASLVLGDAFLDEFRYE